MYPLSCMSIFRSDDERQEEGLPNKPKPQIDLQKRGLPSNLAIMFHATFEKLGFTPNIEFKELGEDMHIGHTPMQYKDND